MVLNTFILIPVILISLSRTAFMSITGNFSQVATEMNVPLGLRALIPVSTVIWEPAASKTKSTPISLLNSEIEVETSVTVGSMARVAPCWDARDRLNRAGSETKTFVAGSRAL